MFSKFSVKRPYTVVVAVVMVLILGYVSFTRMTTDLLPDLELPYAIVITTYVGASPEEVESTVTIPIEESMATINNIENVSSVSNENYSLVILEFAEETNMDSASLDMRESLDQLEAAWNDDMIGSPIIMKINPTMLPIMIAGVESNKIESATELTAFVEENILPELQSVEGVASVSTSGGLIENVQVILRQEKIDEVNEKIHDSLDRSFADAEKEIKKGKKDLDKAKDDLKDTQDSLNNSSGSMAEQIGAAQGQLTGQQASLMKTQADLEKQLETAKSALNDLLAKKEELVNTRKELVSQKSALESQRQELSSTLTTLKALPSQLEAVNEGVSQLEQAVEGLETAKSMLPGLYSQRDSLKEQIEQMTLYGQTDAIAQLQGALSQVNDGIEQIEAGLMATGLTDFSESSIDSKINELNASLTELQATQAQLEEAVASLDENVKAVEDGIAAIDDGIRQIDDGIKQIDDGMPQMDDGIKQLEDGVKQLEDGLEQVKTGQTTLTDALSQLNAQSISGTIQMAVGMSQVSAGLTQLESAKAEIDKAEDTLKDTKESAYKSADMNEIVTLDLLKQLLTAHNFSMPAGYITEEGIQYLIRVGDKIRDTDGLENLMLMDLHMDGVDPIRLSDVADVLITNNSDEVYANLNGHAGIMFTMEKQTGYSTGNVCDKLLARFADLEEEYPDLHFVTLMDQGVYIDLIVNSVLGNLMTGAILAIIILILFLKDLRPTFIIACAIPLSVLTGIVLMYFTDISLNIISLSGLALGVGMLVDNSIVVIENIYRMRREGVLAKRAAIEGASQVSGAIIASTLTTVCVFAPIVFTSGLTKQLFVDLGLTIAYVLLASLIVAMTLVPMMASRMLRNTKEKKQPFLDMVQRVYAASLRVCLKLKPVVLIVAIALFALSAKLAFSRGTALMPDMDSNQATVTVRMPEEAPFSDLKDMADEVTKRLLTIEDINDIGSMAGSSGGGMSVSGLMGGRRGNSATMYLILDEHTKLTGDELEKKIYELTEDLDCEIHANTATMDMSAMMSSGVSIAVKGRDLDYLKSTAKEIAAILEGVEGTEDVSDGIGETTPELRIIVDKDKAMKYGLTTAQVYMAVAAEMTQSGSAMKLVTDTYDYDVYLIDGDEEELKLKDIKKLKIKGTNKDKKEVMVKLSKIAEFTDDYGMDSIRRNSQTRYLTVTAKIADGYNIGLVAADINKALESYEAPAGTTFEMNGEDATINDAFEQIGLMLAMAIAFMYLIMVAQFQSLLSPFIIMFTIPLAFTGGLLGLYFTKSTVSMIAMIGFVMLSGIIVNNGIVMVDYINQLRYAGMDKKDAIVEAGVTRLRPILMTALTTILAMSTMMFSNDMGAAMSKAMAVVVVGGLLYGTVLTLYIVPCVYDIFNRNKELLDPLAEAEKDW